MELSGWVFVATTLIVLGYLVPHLVRSREVRADSRVSDRFSTQLRLVTPALPAPPARSDTRPLVHPPEISRRRTEALAMIRPTTPVASRVNARELAAARAARAAEISRRAAAARRRLTLTVTLAVLTAAVITAVSLGHLAWGWALLPAAALGTVGYYGRQAAILAARQDAKARAEMARLERRLHLFRDSEGNPAVVAPVESEEIVEIVASDVDSDSRMPTADLEHPAAPENVAAPQREDGTWTPTPVPLPTYTLKQESPRRDVAPFTPEMGESTNLVPARPHATPPSYGSADHTEVAQTFDLDSVLARRRAAGA